MDLIKPEDFLSKLCLDTFAGYAQTQIRKAKGLNKKINKPMDAQRKSVLDFCFVICHNGSIPLKEWLKEQDYIQEQCGLVNVEHFRNVYLIYHQSQLHQGWLKGIISGTDADDVQLSSVPKGIEVLPANQAYLHKIVFLPSLASGHAAVCRTHENDVQDYGTQSNERHISFPERFPDHPNHF
jgi:hypothetical protein